ncbi:hypothetical protein [uncultured Stenotrophomonas sp.]|uniref:hypothetical protein n=1 Tax=uncultured Stenotrophomonas sp. TaxID=165438 RepID=UPI002590F467|nr:hypothetical protein [uncultured Stenotrophomonas sp.]
MDAIEKRARELLGRAYEADGMVGRAGVIRNPSQYMEKPDRRALGCIIAALTPPEGYVLVPVELLRMVIGCAYPVSTDINQRGYAWSEAYLDQVLPCVKAALAAARPEVP